MSPQHVTAADVVEHYDYLVKVAQAMLRGVTDLDIYDIIQLVAVNLLVHPATVRTCSVKTYLAKAVATRCMNALRDRGRRQGAERAWAWWQETVNQP